MYRWQYRIALAVLTLGAATSVAAQQDASEPTITSNPWLHVQVVEEGEEGARVNVNLPLSLLEIAAEIALPHNFLSEHATHFEHTEISVQDLKRLWRQLGDSGDAEYVTIEDKGESVHIFLHDETVSVHVDSLRGEEKVRIEVPFRLIDTLLQGEEDELNLTGAIRELGRLTVGDIISIQDGASRIRVWVDDKG